MGASRLKVNPGTSADTKLTCPKNASGINWVPGVTNVNPCIPIRSTPTNPLFVLTLQCRVSVIKCAYRVLIILEPCYGGTDAILMSLIR